MIKKIKSYYYEMNFCWSNYWIYEINWWNTLNIWFGAWKFRVQIFFHFCEKFYPQNLAKSFLRAQILILEFSMVYPRKIGDFIYRMAYSKPENSNSNYSKSAFKECKELWRVLYKFLFKIYMYIKIYIIKVKIPQKSS